MSGLKFETCRELQVDNFFDGSIPEPSLARPVTAVQQLGPQDPPIWKDDSWRINNRFKGESAKIPTHYFLHDLWALAGKLKMLFLLREAHEIAAGKQWKSFQIACPITIREVPTIAFGCLGSL